MRLYLDDNMASPLLARLLRNAGHDVRLPAEVGKSGQDDPVHFTQAVKEGRVCLTRNHGDFLNLHDLIMETGGHHPGILIERFDKNPKNNLTLGDIVRAIRNLETAGVPLIDQCYVLNHWQ